MVRCTHADLTASIRVTTWPQSTVAPPDWRAGNNMALREAARPPGTRRGSRFLPGRLGGEGAFVWVVHERSYVAL